MIDTINKLIIYQICHSYPTPSQTKGPMYYSSLPSPNRKILTAWSTQSFEEMFNHDELLLSNQKTAN